MKKYLSTNFIVNTSIIALYLFSGATLTAQVPFQCDGTMYVNTEENGLYEIAFDADSDTVMLNFLFEMDTGYDILEIGYNSKDNLIYGLARSGYEYALCRIDKTGNVEILKDLPFDSLTQLYIFAADVSPNGSSIFFIVTPRTGYDQLLMSVELLSGNYEVSTVPITTTVGDYYIRMSDFAFSPIDYKLYGFEDQSAWMSQPNPFSERLVVIDTLSGLVDNTLFDQPSLTGFYFGAMFDPFGVMYGVFGISQISTWYVKLSTTDGEVEHVNPAQYINWVPNHRGFSDACSCPYTLIMEHEITPDASFACSELEFVFKVTNLTRDVQQGIVFSDTLPAGFVFKEVESNPFGGLVSGLNTRILTIAGMELPRGTDSLVFKVYVEEGVAGDFLNQGFLSNLALGNLNIAGNTIKSDFKPTLVKQDPTPFKIEPLNIDLAENTFELCPDSFILLTTIPLQNGLSFQWSTGAEVNNLEVAESGTYSVTVTGGCERDSAEFVVIDSPLFVDLGIDTASQFGDLIEISPEYQFLSPITSYQWEINSPNELDCSQCPENSFELKGDAVVSLIVENESGCSASSSFSIEAIRQVYAPNAISPNDDGLNDAFILFSKYDLPIKKFVIFDRWGGLVYDAEKLTTNSAIMAWQGLHNDERTTSGTYTWVAEVEFPDGIAIQYSGGVTVLY
ncbi:MAG: gliding motility-associated C-terminal domain-containing protein [Saprospiraceae bacterium]|nr:gliding motility-associated C-terminal domain-containing protein [Saprospiraceae bacterium]